MKNLSISFLICFVLFFCTIANAQNINTNGLTEEQKAQLALQAAQMKNSNDAPGSMLSDELNPERLNEWVDLGKNIGLAVTATAKELGVAADEFLNSTTGKITIVLIVWRVMGEDILGVVGGTIAWIILINIILWSFKYFHMKKKVVNKKEGTVEYVKRYEFESGDALVCSAVLHIIAFVLVTTVSAAIIF